MPQIALGCAIAGGVLMGVGAGLLLLFNGRIGGIGGSYGGVLTRDFGPGAWKVLYLAGIALGGIAAWALFPTHSEMSALQRPVWLILASGLLMGVGGRMCNGCTSGHGVCGIARLSKRSIVATCTFFAVTLLTVYVFHHRLELF